MNYNPSLKNKSVTHLSTNLTASVSKGQVPQSCQNCHCHQELRHHCHHTLQPNAKPTHNVGFKLMTVKNNKILCSPGQRAFRYSQNIHSSHPNI